MSHKILPVITEATYQILGQTVQQLWTHEIRKQYFEDSTLVLISPPSKKSRTFEMWSVTLSQTMLDNHTGIRSNPIVALI